MTLPDIDFVSLKNQYRLGRQSHRDHGVVKATGILKKPGVEVIDATAGLGRDAFLLASLGARVTLVERSPGIFVALQAALDRAREAGPDFAEIAGRMTCVHADAKDVLAELPGRIITIDPMHPERTKSALVKAEMRQLRDIVGSDPDSLDLIKAALALPGRRVVVKWPRRGAALNVGRKPTFQITGKTVRYDVFD